MGGGLLPVSAQWPIFVIIRSRFFMRCTKLLVFQEYVREKRKYDAIYNPKPIFIRESHHTYTWLKNCRTYVQCTRLHLACTHLRGTPGSQDIPLVPMRASLVCPTHLHRFSGLDWATASVVARFITPRSKRSWSIAPFELELPSVPPPEPGRRL